MSGVVVAGASGGCGVTTLACAMAIEQARGDGGPILIGAGCHPGGPADLWGVPAARSLDDLLHLGDDLGPGHVAHVIHEHASGMGVIVGPRSPVAAVAWRGAPLDALVAGIAGGRDWIADVGRAGTPLADALAARAETVVVVVPTRVASASQAARLIDQVVPARMIVVASPVPGAGDLSARALRRALGDMPMVEMPSDRRGAADVGAGRMSSRRGLGRAVAELAGLR